MPRGWYLAQGFIPLGYSSSDDEEGPCELPDGRLVCGPHGLVTCYRCGSDYSLMDEVLGNSEGDEDEDEDENELFDAEIREMYENLSSGARSVFRSRYGSPPPSGRARAETGNSSSQGASSNTVPPGDALLPTLLLDSHHPRPSLGSSFSTPLHPTNYDDSDMPDVDDMFGLGLRRGTGRVFPTVFTPSPATINPIELFPGKPTYLRITRYIHRHDPQKILIFTDGACLNNGQPNPKAGWAFVHGPGFGGQPAVASGRLENGGPFGDPGIQSSNRAEMRAVIAALRFRAWDGEGYKTIVIATDSEYVTKGSTAWVQTWIRNGWQKNDKSEVKNKDLWEALLGEAERLEKRGVSIQFWRIGRDWNGVADAAAKKAAERDDAAAEWGEVIGVPC